MRSLDPNILLIEWEAVMENYQIQFREIDALRNAIENYTRQHGPIMLLVTTFDGIIVDAEIQKKLQNKQLFGGIRAVAIELRSTTHRISLNLSSQMSRNKVPIKAFASEVNAYKWLRRKSQ
jgi:hypothetical protein